METKKYVTPSIEIESMVSEQMFLQASTGGLDFGNDNCAGPGMNENDWNNGMDF